MSQFIINLKDRHICGSIMESLCLRDAAMDIGIPQNSCILRFNFKRLHLNGTRDMILDDYWSRLPHPVAKERPTFENWRTFDQEEHST